MLSALAGATLGISVAAAVLLTYKGEEPVNVAWFFACTVGIQWVILAAALGIWLLRCTTHLFENFHPLRKPLSGLLWSSTALHQLPGERREHLRARLMGIDARARGLPAVGLAASDDHSDLRRFFNLGVLIALLLPLGRDVAFGVAIDPEDKPGDSLQLGFLDRAPLVLPAERPSEPTGSRAKPVLIQRGDKIALSAGDDLLVAFPALRDILLRISGSLCSADLVRLELARGAARLFLRPTILWRAFSQAYRTFIQGNPDTEKPALPESFPLVDHNAGGACLALIASELELQEDEIETGLSERFGWRLSRPVLPVRIDDPGGNSAELEKIAREAPSLAGVAGRFEGAARRSARSHWSCGKLRTWRALRARF